MTNQQTQPDPRRLRAYAVRASEYDDCQIVVIARNRQEAKRLGYPVLCGWSDYCEYIEVRVRRIWSVDVPDRITEPTAIEHCCGNEDWICAAWRYSEMCEGCVHQDAKREQEEDLYGDY